MRLIVTKDRKAYIEARNAPKLKRFDARIEIGFGEKSATAVKDGDRIIDYRDVTIRGYLSTFVSTTPMDRVGDYVLPGSFTDTIKSFLKNPIILTDHERSCESAIGHFTLLREDDKGLYIEGSLTNCPCDDCLCTRFKVADGTLKTMSMGGMFSYMQDGRGINRVELWEGSIVPIPANPDCIISTRALNSDEIEFVKSGGRLSFQDFLQQRKLKTV